MWSLYDVQQARLPAIVPRHLVSVPVSEHHHVHHCFFKNAHIIQFLEFELTVRLQEWIVIKLRIQKMN